MRTWILAIALAAAACGGSGGSSEPDAFFSLCGQPGDQGNSLGVGQFCAEFSDCGTTVAAPLCSSLGDPQTHFCTKTCTSNLDAGTLEEQCGENASCECNGGGQCGCTPTSCL